MYLWRWIVGVVVGTVAALTLVCGDNGFHSYATGNALRRAGYGEFVIKRSWHFYCPFGQATFAFISNSRNHNGLDSEGYVCTGYFGEASVHETKLYPDEDIDWE